jgi:hypothetical protein
MAVIAHGGHTVTHIVTNNGKKSCQRFWLILSQRDKFYGTSIESQVVLKRLNKIYMTRVDAVAPSIYNSTLALAVLVVRVLRTTYIGSMTIID